MSTIGDRSDWLDRVTPLLLVVLAAAAAIGGLLRVLAFDESILDRLDNTTLVYFTVAGALLLLRNVKTLAFGDFKVELERMREAATEAKEAARLAEDAAIYRSVQSASVPTARAVAAPNEGSNPEDPWSGVFEGRSERNERRLSATVTPLSDRPNWFMIRLVVESTAPRRNPLTGSVQFFLHPTFPNNDPVVAVGPSGRCELSLLAWGAFTVGAVTDGGATKLELNLAELDDAPRTFRER